MPRIIVTFVLKIDISSLLIVFGKLIKSTELRKKGAANTQQPAVGSISGCHDDMINTSTELFAQDPIQFCEILQTKLYTYNILANVNFW